MRIGVGELRWLIGFQSIREDSEWISARPARLSLVVAQSLNLSFLGSNVLLMSSRASAEEAVQAVIGQPI